MRQALLTVVAGALLLAGCSAGGDSGEPSAGSTSLSIPPVPTVSPPVPPSQTPSPTATATPSPIEGKEIYPAVDLDVADDSTYLGRAGRVHVTASDKGVLAQRPDGSVAWRLKAPKGLDPYDGQAWLLPAVGVIAYSVPVSMNPWPGRELLRVVDVRSGDLLWTEKDASFVSAGEGQVFTSFCTGRQDEHIGDCTFSARDARSGATRWAVPTYASPRVREFFPGAVALDSYPGSGGSSLQILSTASGAALSTPLPAGFSVTPIASGFLSTGPPDERPGDGCRSTAQGLDLAGNVLWTRSFAVGRSALEKDECAELYGDKLGPSGPYTVQPFDGVMRLLDPASGRTLWAGARAEEARLIHRGVLIAVQTRRGGDVSSRAVDLRSGKELWTDHHDNTRSSDGLSWTVLGRNLLRTDRYCYDECSAQVLRTRDGKPLLVLSGEHALTGPGWVATFTDDRYNRVQVFELP